MDYPRILTIQDISCVGQCSLTVALPILSVCGLETCVLPSAVLSTHTAFSGFTFRDLTDDIPGIAAAWHRANITFDAFYTGYLGSARQIELVQDIMCTTGVPGAKKIIDPAMADDGKLYAGFDAAFAEHMKRLCACADVLLPNLTEACLLTGTPYRENFSSAEVQQLLDRLGALGADTVVLTGVGGAAVQSGVSVWHQGVTQRYVHPRIPGHYHGTGDAFASAFTGALLRGASAMDAAALAADFTVASIRATQDDPAHWYGVKFERALPLLLERLQSLG